MLKQKILKWVAAGMASFWLPHAGAQLVILSDDFSTDGDPVPSPADVGTWDPSSSAPSESGYLSMWGPAGNNVDDRAFAVATQTSPAGTQLLLEWDWNLLANDNPGITYNPIVGFAYNNVDRAMGIRIIYAGMETAPTNGNLFVENTSGDFVDSGVDVPVGEGFQRWRIDYVVGEATAKLTLVGYAPVTDLPITVARPAETITGAWFLGSGSTNTRIDNIVLSVLNELSVTAAQVTDTFALEFLTNTGLLYRLQSATNPTTLNYTSTGATIEGDGGTLQMFDPTGFDSNKAYRVIEL